MGELDEFDEQLKLEGRAKDEEQEEAELRDWRAKLQKKLLISKPKV